MKQPKVPIASQIIYAKHLRAKFSQCCCWILPFELTDSRDRARVLVYSPQRTHPSGIFRKGCSILCHVVCLFAKWEAREYPSWHFGFDGPFTFVSDMPHVKKYCFLPVSSHLREQFSFTYFPPIWC